MERLEIYKCEECGLVVEVTTGCNCTPTCCGKEMKRMQPQTAEYKFEKHVPYPEAMDGGTRVLVGKETALMKSAPGNGTTDTIWPGIFVVFSY